MQEQSIACMECGKDCPVTQVVWDGSQWELWCYCPTCDVQTFHDLPEDERHEPYHGQTPEAVRDGDTWFIMEEEDWNKQQREEPT